MKTVNNRGWFFVIPVVILVAFNALIPMMTVVNYSVQETFGNNVFFWQGLDWFEQILRSDRFQAALGRQFLFTAIILAIEVPLGIAVALCMPRKGILGAGLPCSDGVAHADTMECCWVHVEHLCPA
jgi:glycerol transport system permease protein